LGIGDWGLGFGGLGVGVWVLGVGVLGPNPQSPIPNPQSPIYQKWFLFKNYKKLFKLIEMKILYYNN